LYAQAAAASDDPAATATGSERSVNAGPYTDVVSTQAAPMYGSAGLPGTSPGGFAYGFPSPRAAIHPYDQEVHASVESRCGAPWGASWIATATTATAAYGIPARRIHASPAR
jgi:hypothetical protein